MKDSFTTGEIDKGLRESAYKVADEMSLSLDQKNLVFQFMDKHLQYTLNTYERVYKVAYDGKSFITGSFQDLMNHLEEFRCNDGGFFCAPQINMVEMSNLELYSLPDFDGY